MANRNKDEGNVMINTWWVQTLITIGTVLVGISIAWGTYASKIEGLEDNIVRLQDDHDALIALKTKIDGMCEKITEIKSDIKDIKHFVSDRNPSPFSNNPNGSSNNNPNESF